MEAKHHGNVDSFFHPLWPGFPVFFPSFLPSWPAKNVSAVLKEQYFHWIYITGGIRLSNSQLHSPGLVRLKFGRCGAASAENSVHRDSRGNNCPRSCFLGSPGKTRPERIPAGLILLTIWALTSAIVLLLCRDTANADEWFFFWDSSPSSE